MLVVRPSSKLLKAAYLLAALLVVLVYVYNSNRTPRSDWLLAFPILLVAWTALRHLRLRFTRLSLSSGKLRYETGVLSKSTRTMELYKVQNVRVDQHLSQRLLGTGNISIETAGESSRLTMSNIDKPQLIADRILDAARR